MMKVKIKMVKYKRLIGLAVLVLSLSSITGCTKVTAGHEGVMVNMLGDDKGVQQETVGPGRYYVGWNQELYIFPTFTQNWVWTASDTEGSHNDESITFQTINGLNVGADIGIAYHIKPGMTSTVFSKYRRGIDEVTDTFLRNGVRDALISEASGLTVSAVYGASKMTLIENARKHLQEDVKDIGIIIEKLYWIGSLRLPVSVTNSINKKVEATQKAILRENEIAQTINEAKKRVEKARGKAESVTIEAEAEAKAIAIVGKALSDNPMLIQLESVKKWDGVLPRINSGVTPFVNASDFTK